MTTGGMWTANWGGTWRVAMKWSKCGELCIGAACMVHREGI